MSTIADLSVVPREILDKLAQLVQNNYTIKIQSMCETVYNGQSEGCAVKVLLQCVLSMQTVSLLSNTELYITWYAGEYYITHYSQGRDTTLDVFMVELKSLIRSTQCPTYPLSLTIARDFKITYDGNALIIKSPNLEYSVVTDSIAMFNDLITAIYNEFTECRGEWEYRTEYTYSSP